MLLVFFIYIAYFLIHLVDFFLCIISFLHQDLDWSHLFGCIILLVNSTFEVISIVPILGPLNLIIEELSFGKVIFPCFLVCVCVGGVLTAFLLVCVSSGFIGKPY